MNKNKLDSLYSSRKFNIFYQADFSFQNTDNKLQVWLAKPNDDQTQKIVSFSTFPKPQKTYTDGQGNQIYYFKFDNQKKSSLKMEIQAVLSKRKINLMKKQAILKTQKAIDSKRYFKNEKFLEQTAEVKKIIKKEIAKNSTSIEKLNDIFNFVSQNFRYRYPVKNRGVKNLNLEKLAGDCAEYSSLFVTMCRISKIPARNNTGFVIFPKEKTIVEHAWASAYLKPHGWLDFDTQYASIENEPDAFFGQRSDYRINFTNGFNIPLKPAIRRNFSFDFWKKAGLPMTANAVQTLQPLIFASNAKVTFKQKIYFKK
jgi:hypothetical protein